jgi:hypothetical protein
MDARAFLLTLREEWLLVSVLHDRAELDYNELLSLIASHKKSDLPPDSLLSKLCDLGVIEQPLITETIYELNDTVRMLVGYLLNEQRLQLAESIQVYVAEISRRAEQLYQAVERCDQDAHRQMVKLIQQQLNTIRHNLQNDRAAVWDIVARTKKQESVRGLRQRYAMVIDAWERYIEPLGQMVDIRGAFDQAMDLAIQRVDASIVLLEQKGGIPIDAFDLERLSARLLDLKGVAQNTLKECRETLLPLYRRARASSELTRGAAIITDWLRKERKTPEDIAQLVNFQTRQKTGRLAPNDAILMFLCSVHEAPPAPPRRRLERVQRCSAPQHLPTAETTILSQAKRHGNVNDLAGWIIEHFPEVSTDTLLYVLQLALKEGAKRHEAVRHETTQHEIYGSRIELRSSK